MKLEARFITSTKIEEINEAIYVIRHFVTISAKLLPYLAEITSKQAPSVQEKIDRDKIANDVQEQLLHYQLSELMMDSPILELIHDTFHLITCPSSSSTKKVASLNAFLKEYHRLKETWRQVDAN